MVIIEDKSPFYIRYSHDNIDEIVTLCKSIEITSPHGSNPLFTHHRISADIATNIISFVPKFKELEMNSNRVSLFVSKPGLRYVPHRDGTHKIGINYTIDIRDDKCKTNFYLSEDMDEYEIDTIGGLTYNIVGFEPGTKTPIHTMTAVRNEAILFNTEIFHDWDNSTSDNERHILTLRSMYPGKIDFYQAKKILFNM